MGEFLSCVSGSSIVAGFNILVFETSEALADGGGVPGCLNPKSDESMSTHNCARPLA